MSSQNKSPQTQTQVFRASERFRGTAGESKTACQQRFIPAFRRERDGRVEWAKNANGTPAAMHLIAWLPKSWAEQLDSEGRVLKLVEGITSGFCRNGKFYTRDEAAAAQAS